MSAKQNIIPESSERRTHDLQSVSAMLRPLAKKILGRKGFVEIDILTNWEHIVGEELAAFALPQSIDFRRGEKTGGVLKVAVPGGAFALELQHREKSVIQKINAYFGYVAVASLKIIQNAAPEYQTRRERVESVQKNVVSKQEEIYIKELSAGVKSTALQDVLERLGRQIIGHNKEEDKNETRKDY